MVLGVIVLIAGLFLPWVAFDGKGMSGVQLVMKFAEELGEPDSSAEFLIVASAGVIVLLAVLGIASISLPRSIPLIAGIIGVGVMALLFVGFIMTTSEPLQVTQYGVTDTVDLSLGTGFWVAALAFLLMAVLQLIPRPGN